MPVLEIDARPAARLRREAHLHLARPREVGLELPFAVDLPRDDDPVRRLPDEHRSPLAVGAVFLLGVAAPARAALDDRPLHRRLPDVMAARPPAVVFRREDVE